MTMESTQDCVMQYNELSSSDVERRLSLTYLLEWIHLTAFFSSVISMILLVFAEPIYILGQLAPGLIPSITFISIVVAGGKLYSDWARVPMDVKMHLWLSGLMSALLPISMMSLFVNAYGYSFVLFAMLSINSVTTAAFIFDTICTSNKRNIHDVPAWRPSVIQLTLVDEKMPKPRF